jgi:hypothetical protein
MPELKVKLTGKQAKVLAEHLKPWSGDRVSAKEKAVAIVAFVQELVNRTVAEIEDEQLHDDDIPY